MILIAVLGIVAAIAIPAYQDYRERAGSRPALEPEAALYLQSPKRESLEPSRRLT
jgi:Tfp pilus assembly major pilin PilA